MQENSQTFYHILPNGVKIVHRWTPSPVAYVGVMVGAGTKGTAHHSARQIIHAIEGIGGEINAYTTKEETTFYAAILAEHVQLTLHLIAEMIWEPTFKKEETDKERMVIMDEIESYNDSPSELIYDDFESLVFAGSSLEMPILGTKKTLKPEKIFRLAEKEFGSLPTQPQNTPNPDGQPTVNRQSTDGQSPCKFEVSYRKNTHQVHAMLGGKAYHLGHERQLAMFLLNNILGGGSLNSRLNLSLREAKGLVYTVESTYTPLSDTGYWCIYWACDPEDYAQSLALVKKELDKLRETPLTQSALRHALIQLRGQLAISAQNQENAALAMAKSMLYHGSAPDWQQTFEKVSLTTPQELLGIANDLFLAQNRYILTYK